MTERRIILAQELHWERGDLEALVAAEALMLWIGRYDTPSFLQLLGR